MKLLKNIVIEVAALLVFTELAFIVDTINKNIRTKQIIKEEDRRLRKKLGTLEIVPRKGGK